MIHVGDCLEVMRTLPDNSVDAVVTDPPYGIGFMGKAWDGKDIEARLGQRRAAPSHDPCAAANGGHMSAAAAAGLYDLSPKAMRAFQAFSADWAREALRVMKPGAHLLSFASPRTYHRMVCGFEDAGLEIRDQVLWLFGSGFPKSRNGEWGGTALKPAHEPICLARKPLSGTVEENWRAHGTGALNIDACRIPVTDDAYARNCSGDRGHAGTRSIDNRGATDIRTGGASAAAGGRWPANLAHDGSEEVVAIFPKEAGAASQVLGTEASRPVKNTYGEFKRGGGAFHGDTGSAARFFYCAKADRSDRNDGCEGMEERPLLWSSGTKNPGSFQAEGTRRSSENNHPTVKPTDLMRWLCRLVTPRGGVVLDPFMGSGSTGRGAIAEGFQFIGIELDPHYARIAEARIRAMQPGLALGGV